MRFLTNSEWLPYSILFHAVAANVHRMFGGRRVTFKNWVHLLPIGYRPDESIAQTDTSIFMLMSGIHCVLFLFLCVL